MSTGSSTSEPSTRAKTRVLMTFLALLAVWPCVQHGLVLRYGVSPWQLCGFGMYCVPRDRLKIDLLEDGRPAPAPLRARLMPWLAAYADRRQALGELAPPDAVARAFFAAVPEAPAVDVVVTTFTFDVPSASFVRKEHRYPYTR